MRHFSRLVIVLATVSAASLTFASNDRQQINALYGKLRRAMMSKSVAGIARLEAPGFTETARGQTLNAAQANAMMKQEFASIKKVTSITMKLTSLKINGSTAHAVNDFSMTATMVGQDKKIHHLKVVGSTTEDLVKTSKGWLYKNETDNGSKAYLDGKPMPGM